MSKNILTMSFKFLAINIEARDLLNLSLIRKKKSNAGMLAADTYIPLEICLQLHGCGGLTWFKMKDHIQIVCLDENIQVFVKLLTK